MTDMYSLFLAKAEECLAGAESEFANKRYNNCANRCYYSRFGHFRSSLLNSGATAYYCQADGVFGPPLGDFESTIDRFTKSKSKGG